MVYAILVALAVVSFLIGLNGFLRGAKKAQIDAVLSLVVLSLIATSFFEAGWKVGLLSIAIAFVSTAVTRPLAARLASTLFRSSTGGREDRYVGLPPKTLERISHRLGAGTDPSKVIDDFLHGTGRGQDAVEDLLDYCERDPDVQQAMRAFQISRSDMKDLYWRLLAVGAGQWAGGHWVAASAIAYPEALRYLLSREGGRFQETAFHLIMHFERGERLQA